MTTRQDALAATVASEADLSLQNTVAAGSPVGATSISQTLTMTTRPAVLPRDASGDLPLDPGERYAKKHVLGVGGMGEVVLAEDRDIGRNVALKYLNAPNDKAALARFVDEIRIVGSLEHPNIVPIHDVGVDDNNRFYFVMKHVEGETLESIIEHLAAGDVAYHKRFTYTARVEIFLALLRALSFAHANGYVHRDIKPANVMIGRFGEVVLMDWGVAKRCKEPDPHHDPNAPELTDKPIRERLFTTRRGAIVGTPVYMSPEQARGDVDAIDERSDVYCATVLFHELVTLHHYLGERETLKAMLDAIQHEPPLLSFGHVSHPMQGPAPAEFTHFAKKGLAKNPADRYQNVGEMITILEDALDGRVLVQCPFTLQKRITRELGRFTDHHPMIAMSAFIFGAASFLGSVGWTVMSALHH